MGDYMNCVIRYYCNEDFEMVKSILINSFPEVNDLLEKSLISYKNLDLDKNKYIQLVAEVDGKTIGYLLASWSFDPVVSRMNMWIDYVCVDDNYRGRGIAKEILIKLEEIAKEENVMFLQLTSSRFRTSARKLYSDLGFSLRESDIFRKVLE